MLIRYDWTDTFRQLPPSRRNEDLPSAAVEGRSIGYDGVLAGVLHRWISVLMLALPSNSTYCSFPSAMLAPSIAVRTILLNQSLILILPFVLEKALRVFSGLKGKVFVWL